MTSTLGYWNLRGLAHPIRLLLTYAGEKFEDKVYVMKGTAPNYDLSNWTKEKYSHNLDFPNLPYYVDENVRITQSTAILRYLARKYHLGGKTESEKTRIDVIDSQMYDLRTDYFKLCFSLDFENDKAEYIKNVPAILKEIGAFLGENKYFAGANFTYADILAYEYLYQQRTLVPNVLNDYPNLKQFYERFEAIPQLTSYIKTAPASGFAPTTERGEAGWDEEIKKLRNN